MYLELLKQYDEYLIFIGMVIAVLTLYFSASAVIKSSRMTNDNKRRVISKIRTIFIFLILITTFVVWAKELYQVIISLAAIGAGLAIAFKEVFLCFGGGFYRAFAQPFSVGDRIEINGIRGDVIDIGLMGTQLLEVGPKDYTHQYTGRTVSFPNSLILTSNVLNESDSAHDADDFALHIFTVPIKNDSNWDIHRNQLLDSAKDVCNQYVEDAQKFFQKLAKKRSVDTPWVEPRINMRFSSTSQLDLIVRVTVPVKMKGTVEQLILTKYLEQTH